MPKKIDPAKAGKVQAPHGLRVGARNADAPAPEKKDEQDPKTDEKAREEERASCAEACRSAESVYTSAAEKMGAAAKELEGGGDSLSILMAAEDAAKAADDASDDVLVSLTSYRGAEPPASSSNPGAAPNMGAAPPAPDAQSIARVAGPNAAAQLELTQLSAIYRSSGAKSVAAFSLKWQAGQTALAEVAKFRAAEQKREREEKVVAAKAEEAKKVARLESAVHAGMPLAQAFAVDEKGNRTPKQAWLSVDLATLDAQLVELGYPAGAEARIQGAPSYARSTLFTPLADGEAGLAARAAASRMTIEERRAAEARIAASIAEDQEQSR